ncbi:SMP-30/gluconolactonase/LRE family protein [Mangrovicoccus ximenensis]|uniref:SMP-30/gluconolactonase/LRE family protein n=1 Tax=Mangrovicoccus ximenensis TaxID=1911570 RepID=UPI000D3902FA|nr:SMP-30/gluconolactonase/LRE family protein [Mangrovicoccus ximenensis]
MTRIAAASVAGSLARVPAFADGGDAIPSLGAAPASAVPIPSAEAGLDTVVAEHWLKVSDKGVFLEGPAFDRQGDLIFTLPLDGGVVRATMDRQMTTLIAPNPRSTGGTAIHRDGRIFVASPGNFTDGGSIFAINPDGSGLTDIVSPDAGLLPDDLVFDAEGGFYFTDFQGTSTEPVGGIYHVGPEGGDPVAILPNMALANGIALSPDGTELWSTEFSRNLLHRVQLADATTVAPFGTTIGYHFNGPAPDSMRIDADGNLYVALFGQGRVLVFNRAGIPIGQVLIPGRDEGHNLISTSLALRPGTNELFIVTSDAGRGEGANIFRARVYGEALQLYSHS